MSFKSWLKMSLEGWKNLLFKIKKSPPKDLPQSPKQEIQSSNSQNDIVVQSLDVKLKQEQTQWFQKKNDLRNVDFDLNPVWDNGHQLYGTSDAPGDDYYRHKELDEMPEYQPPAEIRAIEVKEDRYMDEVKGDSNPWKDMDNFPIKDYPLTPQEAIKLQPKDDHDEQLDSSKHTYLNEHHNHHYDTDHHNIHADSTDHSSHDFDSSNHSSWSGND